MPNSGCTPGDASPTVDTIQFSLPAHSTIPLASELPHIADAVNLVGPGADQLDVHRASGGDYRVLTIDAGTVSISGLTFSNGVAVAQGGGIMNNGGMSLKLDRVHVVHNTVNSPPSGIANGGGVWSSSATLTIDRSAVIDNTVNASSATHGAGSAGGGIYNDGTLTADHSTVSGNTVSTTQGNPTSLAEGGGIYQTDAGNATIRRSTLNANTASAGGASPAINNQASGGGIVAGGTFHLDRVTVSGNTASVSAGSLALGGGVDSSFHGAMTIHSSTLTANTAKFGANFVSENSNGSFANTIVSNPKGGGANCGIEMSSISNGYNLEDDPGPTPSCGFTKPTDHAGVNPDLGPLHNNGGPTRTHALLPGSPAIDQGRRAFLELTDQRGLSRPSDFGAIPNAAGGDGSDIGAFELQDVAPPNTLITKHPKKKTRRRTVKFRFQSTEPSSHFQCKIDKQPFAPCSSPKKYKHLKLGRHTFRVRAIDLAGNVDPSAARFRFKVVRKKH